MMLKDDVAILSVQSHTTLLSPDAIAYQTLQEAAKFTLEHGYRYFQIAGSQDTTRQLTMFMPGSVQTSGAIYGSPNFASYNASTTYQPPHSAQFQYAGDRVEIKMFPDGAPQADEPRVFDARRILPGKAKNIAGPVVPITANPARVYRSAIDQGQADQNATVATAANPQQASASNQVAHPATQPALTAAATSAPAVPASAPGYWLPGMPLPQQPQQ
jgi:hypothetical protein